jgi:hypothetical protein
MISSSNPPQPLKVNRLSWTEETARLLESLISATSSNPSTLTSGVEALTIKLGAAETAKAEAMRATRKARKEEESIVMKAAKAIDETTPMEL